MLLRQKPGLQRTSCVEAVRVDDEDLRDRVFGDLSMHEMALYRKRIEDLAVAAVTGRESF